jgi:hypothetical protein
VSADAIRTIKLNSPNQPHYYELIEPLRGLGRHDLVSAIESILAHIGVKADCLGDQAPGRVICRQLAEAEAKRVAMATKALALNSLTSSNVHRR